MHRLSLPRPARALAAGALLFAASPALAQTVFVDANLTTGAGDGSTWADAYQGPDGLQAALTGATSGMRIFVADGTYRATSGTSRLASFQLRSGVEIYGGFEGGEADLADRPDIGAFPSVLSGDLLGNDTASAATRNDNTHNVLNAQGANDTALIDGFTITGGNANASRDRGAGILCQGPWRPVVRNCRFVDNRCTFGGGAGYVNQSGAPRFENCQFLDNRGGSFGGAFDVAGGGAVTFDGCYFEGNSANRAGALEFFQTSQALIVNSVFVGNSAGTGGGLWFGSNSNSRLINCTVVGNTANTGGGISVQSANPQIRNCILWDNQNNAGAQNTINQISGSSNVRHCIIEGGFAGGVANLGGDPLFADPANGDYTPMAGSPAIDSADGSALPTEFTLDFAGRRRAADDAATANTGAGNPAFLDRGAFEMTDGLGTFPACSVNPNSIVQRGQINAFGSLSVNQNDLTLEASLLPPNVFGIFLASVETGFTASPGGSFGNLCLGGDIGRFNGPGQILDSGSAGSFSLALDLTAIPTPNVFVAVQPGSTWYFQTWHRDSTFGIQSSNFTDVVRLDFQP